MTVTLQEPLGEYFAAANTDDPDRIAACFSKDAVVTDEKQTYQGQAAIRAWAEEARRKYQFQADVVAVEAGAVQTVVTAHLTGDFPGNPVDLRYAFTIADREINALEIA